MNKFLKEPFVILVVLQVLTTILSLLSIYLLFYPTFFDFHFPSNPSSNILLLLITTPFIFDNFYLFVILKNNYKEWFSLFKQRIYFETLIKATFIVLMILTSPNISIIQLRIYYFFLFSLLIDLVKFSILLLIKKKELEEVERKKLGGAA